MVFGHRKCFGGYWVLIGSAERSSGHPGKDMGLMGHEREHTKMGWCPPIKADPMRRRRKEGRERKVWSRTPPSFPLPPLSFPLLHTRKGEAHEGRSPRAGG